MSVLGPDCGPHCGFKDGLVGHCPCSKSCHGRTVTFEDVVAGVHLDDDPTPEPADQRLRSRP